MPIPAVQTESLCKVFGNKLAVDRVDLTVNSGKLVGFLGPNGAGKSTTLRIILGLLRPTSGIARVFGVNCHRDGKQLRRRIGFLPGDTHLYSGMTGLSTLMFFARVRKVDCREEINRLADAFELPLNRRIRKYSTGMKQKLGLIQAMMHRPDLLILDEPTSALDPLVRTVVFDELRRAVGHGRTVLFSSHSLDEVEELCDEVVILRSGQLVEQQSIQVLRDRALRKVTLVFADPETAPREMPESISDQLKLIHRRENCLQLTFSGAVDQLLDFIRSLPVKDVMIEKPDLNDLFLAYYHEQEQ